MARIRIKATIEKKDENLKTARNFIEILKFVNANEKLLFSFKEKYDDWSRNFSKEWLSCGTAKTDVLQRLEPSKFIRIISTAIISLCLLEHFRCSLSSTSGVSYFILGLGFYLLFVIMNIISSAWIYYFCSPSKDLFQVSEYFEYVLSMSRLLSRRVNLVQRRLNLNVEECDKLHLDFCSFENTTETKFSYSSFSLYHFYGILMAFFSFATCGYLQFENFDVLEIFTICSIVFISFAKAITIFKFSVEMTRKRQQLRKLTEDFMSWFDNECELKRSLQEPEINTDLLFIFPPKSSEILLKGRYLNLVILIATCERVLRSNLREHDLEKLVLVLLYGQYSILRQDLEEDEFIEITNFNSRETPSLNAKSPVRSKLTDGKKIRDGNVNKNRYKTVKKMGRHTSRERDALREIDNIDGVGLSKPEDFVNIGTNNKSQIPRYIGSKQSTQLCAACASGMDIKEMLQSTSFEENLPLRRELRNSEHEVNTNFESNATSNLCSKEHVLDTSLDGTSGSVVTDDTLPSSLKKDDFCSGSNGDLNSTSDYISEIENEKEMSVHEVNNEIGVKSPYIKNPLSTNETTNRNFDAESEESSIKNELNPSRCEDSRHILPCTQRGETSDAKFVTPRSSNESNSLDNGKNEVIAIYNKENEKKIVDSDSMNLSPEDVHYQYSYSENTLIDSKEMKAPEKIIHYSRQNLAPFSTYNEKQSCSQTEIPEDISNGFEQTDATSAETDISDHFNPFHTSVEDLNSVDSTSSSDNSEVSTESAKSVIEQYILNEKEKMDSDEANATSLDDSTINTTGYEISQKCDSSISPNEITKSDFLASNFSASTPNNERSRNFSQGQQIMLDSAQPKSQNCIEEYDTCFYLLSRTREESTENLFKTEEILSDLRDQYEDMQVSNAFIADNRSEETNVNLSYTPMTVTAEESSNIINACGTKGKSLKNLPNTELNTAQTEPQTSGETASDVFQFSACSGKKGSLENLSQTKPIADKNGTELNSSSDTTSEVGAIGMDHDSYKPKGNVFLFSAYNGKEEPSENLPQIESNTAESGIEPEGSGETTFEVGAVGMDYEPYKPKGGVFLFSAYNGNEEPSENLHQIESNTTQTETEPKGSDATTSGAGSVSSGYEFYKSGESFQPRESTMNTMDSTAQNRNEQKILTGNLSTSSVSTQSTDEETNEGLAQFVEKFFQTWMSSALNETTKKTSGDISINGNLKSEESNPDMVETEARGLSPPHSGILNGSEQKVSQDTPAENAVNASNLPEVLQKRRIIRRGKKWSQNPLADRRDSGRQELPRNLPDTQAVIAENEIKQDICVEPISVSKSVSVGNKSEEQNENLNRSEESKMDIEDSTAQTGNGQIVSAFKSSITTNSKNEQINEGLSLVAETVVQTLTLRAPNETEEDISNANISSKTIVSESIEKEELNGNLFQTDGMQGDSKDLNESEQEMSSEPISTVNVTSQTDKSSDLNPEPYISLNERKALLADNLPLTVEFDNCENSLVTSSSEENSDKDEEEMLDTSPWHVAEREDNLFTIGRASSSSSLNYPPKNMDHQKCDDKDDRLIPHFREKRQKKTRQTCASDLLEDDEKECEKSKRYSSKKWYGNIIKKKNRRYLCLQKYRMGITIEEDGNIERNESWHYERQSSDVRSGDRLSATEDEKRHVESFDLNNGSRVHTENSINTNKSLEITNWIKLCDISKNSATESERPHTGTSEDENFHFHPSTSPSDSTSPRKLGKSSNSSDTTSDYSSTPQNKQSDYDDTSRQECEDFCLKPQEKHISDATGNLEQGVIWQSNLCFNEMEETTDEKRDGEHGIELTANSRLTADRSSRMEGSATSPLKYHLKYENLDVNIVDIYSQLTIRFVSENEGAEPKYRKFVKTPSSFSSINEVLLPAGTSSQHSGHLSPTHSSDIPEINDMGDGLRMSVEKLNSGETSHPSHKNASNDKNENMSSGSSLDRPGETQGNGELAPAVANTKDETNSCLHPVAEETQTLKPSSTGQDKNHTGMLQSNENETGAANQSFNNDSKGSESVDDRGNQREFREGESLGSTGNSKDFIFDSKTLKINYKPDPKSDSIAVSFRKQQGVTKMTFKSQQKKLYLKMSS